MDPKSTNLKEILEEICSTSYLHISKNQLADLLNDPFIDRCFGCFFGALIGDALGSFCQFEGVQTKEKMDIAMQMPGGGPFHLKPGQITDDSQMALHMLNALHLYNPKIPLPQQIPYIQYGIAKQYIRWLNSSPFDIGITCRNAISTLQKNLTFRRGFEYDPKLDFGLKTKEIKQAVAVVAAANKESLSNGFLMKITPMACFHALLEKYHGVDRNTLRKMVQAEATLIHSHPLAIESAVEWVEMLSSIIQTNSPNALAHIENLNKIFKQFILKKSPLEYSLKKQIINQIQNRQPIKATQKIGYFKHAYHFAMYQMKAIEHSLNKLKEEPNYTINLNSEYYKRSLRFVIQQGGDTDTNACIVGGLVGVMVGFRHLPQEYLVKQMGLGIDPKSRNNQGWFYEPKNGLLMMLRIIKKLKK